MTRETYGVIQRAWTNLHQGHWLKGGGGTVHQEAYSCGNCFVKTSLTSHSSLWSLLAGETLICIDQHAETLPISIHGLGGYSLLTDCNLRGPII